MTPHAFAATPGIWIGQTFLAETDYTVFSVKLNMRRDGNPGDITVAIMSCNILDYYGGPWWDGYYAHMPTGNILTSVTVPEENISEGFGWVEFSLIHIL